MISHVPISSRREALKRARDRYGRAKTYDNALALQQAIRDIERFFNDERSFFMVFDGVGNTTSGRGSLTELRIIEGHKDKWWNG